MNDSTKARLMGIDHIAIEVDDVDAALEKPPGALEELTQKGMAPDSL